MSEPTGPGAGPDMAEAFARIRLLRSPNVGPITFFQLVRRFGSAVAALEALPDLAARGGARHRVASEAKVQAEIAAVKAAGARYLFHDSPGYPAPLREAEGAPPILIARGQGALASRPAVAMVGARNASAGALRLARTFASDLAGKGRAVVSGLARGIDAAAHRGALAGSLAGAAEGGGTIAVIAGGIDVAYPPEHAELQAEIAEQGLLVTEQPPGVEPQARHFPARNRIIAGLAAGTVIVEAAPSSGSLITARLAADMGREVMAVPGSPLDGRSLGCNRLIRDGAILVQSADDIIEALADFTGVPRIVMGTRLREEGEEWDSAPAEAGPLDPDAVAALLGMGPVPVDDLIRLLESPAGAVHGALLELELAGRLQRHAGGRVSLA